jgi:S-adenosylmethionine-diacylglycerol 3-amino-3-carboxypropyl transferase
MDRVRPAPNRCGVAVLGQTDPAGSTRGDWKDAGLLYSQCWEDMVCARSALRIRSGDDVLAIGAAGDNVLGLLLDEPRSVLSIDINPAQTALVELKRVAVRSLPSSEVGAFLGAGRDCRRLGDYERVRAGMSRTASAYWDHRLESIQEGVIHVGRFERYLAVFRERVMRFVPGSRAVAAMLAAQSLPEQRRVYVNKWDSPLWRALVRICFGRKPLSAWGRHPRMFAHAGRVRVGEYYLGQARHALTEISIATNPYVTYMLTGSYDLEARMPAYLVPAVATRIAPLADRVEVATASLTEALRQLPSDSIDAFYLSDVFELFDPDAYEEALEEVTRVGRRGARICYWNNLVPRARPASMADKLASHSELATCLHQQDRAFLYSRFVVESVRDPGQ